MSLMSLIGLPRCQQPPPMTRRDLLRRSGSALALAATGALAPLVSSGCGLEERIRAFPALGDRTLTRGGGMDLHSALLKGISEQLGRM